MAHVGSRSVWTAAFIASLLLANPPARGQDAGVSTSLSGLVVDTTGAVVPGVDVAAKNNATSGESRAVTDGGGRFAIPALQPGTYTVTVSRTGFKTAVLPDVQLLTATPQSVKVTLELGTIDETVVVSGAAGILHTQTAAVQTTIAVEQFEQVPLVTRSALDYVVTLPGVSTPGSASRSSTLVGLPGYTNNITLDGINVQENRGREGFYIPLRPLIDSVQEITVSISTPGAESTGQGATQIRMVTRSGSNRFAGAVYNTWRNQAGTNDKDAATRAEHPSWIWRLNTPYWFDKRDLPKTAAGDDFIADMRLQTPGFRVGGPVLKDRLFYFFNWEWSFQPSQSTRARYLLNPQAQQGLFTYAALDGTTRTIDLLAQAASKGQTPIADPVIAKLLADIRQAAGTTGSVDKYDLNVDKFSYSLASRLQQSSPTLRVDYNLTQTHRLTFTARYRQSKSRPDLMNATEPLWPGFPGEVGQYVDAYMLQGTLRSTFGKNVVNEARLGYSNGGRLRLGSPSQQIGESLFNCEGLGCQSVGGKGYSLGIGTAASGITGATASGILNLSDLSPPNYSYDDTLTWLRGKHSLSMGVSLTQIRTREFTDALVPSIGFGLSNLDPAYTYFTAASGNYTGGISSTSATQAQSLFAVLTGRVTSISGNAYLDDTTAKYAYLGQSWQRASMDELGVFISDSWRIRPNLTVTGGLRYELQLPFEPDGDSYHRLADWRMVYGITGEGNLFKPGTLSGTAPLLVNYTKGSGAYKTDINNIAPSVGVAWRPTLEPSLLTKILSTDPVIRGGYSMSCSRVGTTWFTGTYGTNPGRSRTAARSTTVGCNGACFIGFDGFPVLLRDTDRLWPGTFPDAPTYPFSPAVNESIDEYQPDTRVPATHQWSAGWQRELGKSMALEVRYLGNSNRGALTSYNINGSSNWNILENGFYDEFRKAQANLRANIVAGRGVTFAYTGAAGTSPLPIFMAYFKGIPLNDARNQDTTQYTSSQFTSSSWYSSLGMYSPSITGMAGTGTSGLQNTSYASNAKAAGLPANFFMANPDIAQGGSYLEANGGNTQYHALQVELRRRMSRGLLLQGSYDIVLSRRNWAQNSLREDWYYYDSGGRSHTIKFSWVFQLPFGRGRPFGGGVSRALDILIGGWEVNGVGRFQSGPAFNYGGYRLVGMTEKDLQKMFKFYERPDASGKVRIYMFPQDVIDNSILALYSTSATTASGYAGALPTGRYFAPASGPDCVQYVVTKDRRCPGTAEARYVNGPWYWKIDMSFVKQIAVVKTMRIEARMDLFNVFDTINFDATSRMGFTPSSWEVTSAARDSGNSQDAGGRVTSFGLRFTW